MSPRIQLYDRTRSELADLLGEWGFRPHVGRLWKYLYREFATGWGTMPELPGGLRSRLEREAALSLPVAAQATTSHGEQTCKYLLELDDRQRVETVRMQCRGRATACLSSQVGCALGCVFCATGQMGFTRNLTAGEIVAQALYVARSLRDGGEIPDDQGSTGLRNVVLMGMGEPLLNYDAVLQAIRILREPAGLAIAAKRITLSTVGVVPGIIRLADEGPLCSLAVSLHAATQDVRATLVPAAHKWPLDALMEACRYYCRRTNRKIFFEWTVIEDQNDSAEQAQALVRLLQGIPAQVNLIPLNPTAGYEIGASQASRIDAFQATLRSAGLPATVRRRRGIEIAAGCGQLAGA
jgi:23S rRNA (adenine2503-C2)-methyltransferase